MKRIFTLFILILVFVIAPLLMAATTHFNGSPGGAGTDSNAIHDNIANEINSLTVKETPTTSDILIIEDAAASNVKKKITIGTLPSSAGDVIGPATNTDGYIPQWDGADSKTLKDGVELSTDGTFSGNSDAAVPTEKASKTYMDGIIHTQNTDTYLDQGGDNEVTAANAKDAVTKKHTQNSDTYLDYGQANQVSAADAKDAVDKKHTQNSDTGTTQTSFHVDSDNSGPRIKNNAGVAEIRNSGDTDYADVKAKSFTTVQSATQAGGWTGYELSGNGTNYQRHEVGDALGATTKFKYTGNLPSDNYFYFYATPSENVSAVTWGHFSSTYFDISSGEVTHKVATDSLAGISEHAISSEVNTGTATNRSLTPEALRGSNYGAREIGWTVVDSDTAVATGDGVQAYTVPSIYNGWDIVDVIASVHTKGVTGTTDIQVRRRRAGSNADVLSTKITIGDEWYASDEVVNTSNDDLQTGDQLYLDVDAIHSGTAPYGLSVTVIVRLPGV